jgi:hypothetical protein
MLIRWLRQVENLGDIEEDMVCIFEPEIRESLDEEENRSARDITYFQEENENRWVEDLTDCQEGRTKNSGCQVDKEAKMRLFESLMKSEKS